MKSPLKLSWSVFLGGPWCGAEENLGVRCMLLDNGSRYDKTDEKDSEGRIIYRHSWKKTKA